MSNAKDRLIDKYSSALIEAANDSIDWDNVNDNFEAVFDFDDYLKDFADELETQTKEIDWEQRRYEIAKSIMTTAMTNSNFSINNPKYFAGLVVSYTDALIEELKK